MPPIHLTERVCRGNVPGCERSSALAQMRADRGAMKLTGVDTLRQLEVRLVDVGVTNAGLAFGL